MAPSEEPGDNLSDLTSRWSFPPADLDDLVMKNFMVVIDPVGTPIQEALSP